MIIFKTMEWSYAFSYGPNNVIDFRENPIVQLVGKNGHGKSSIALILEEVLYNKNSKGVKKAKVLNRHTKAKSYTIKLSFDKDGDEYTIETVRGATQTVKLICNGTDISAHTSTATYKLIEEIIGYDHKTFTQIVYQNSAFSLEFLTATDTNRKKFLIELLRLSRYTDLAERVKVDLKTANQEAEALNMRLASIDSWLSKYKAEDLVYRNLHEVPEAPTAETKELIELEASLLTFEQTNKKIIQNNKYIEILQGMDVEMLPAPTADILAIKVKLSEINTKVKQLRSIVDKTGTILSKCPSCGQKIDNSHKEEMLQEARAALPEAMEIAKVAAEVLQIAEAEKAKYDASVVKVQEWEKYSSLVDRTLRTDLLDQKDIAARVATLRTYINTTNAAIKKLNADNVATEAHNAKAKVLLAQIGDMQTEKKTLWQKIAVASARVANLQILVKTLSPSGFVAYKIESLVKDLEELTNEYLTEMTDGRFQLSFRISSSDKLDVVITDNGDEVDIFELSNGELARVNTSTLLAIRKLLQSLSNVRTNLLILDETTSNLDLEGKEKLVELLIKETSLNTILVSHDFTHPLIAKIDILKTDGISKIIYD